MEMTVHRPSRSETRTIRGLSCHIRRWGRADAPPLVMLHGARDSSVTHQFVVDALRGDWQVIAPDWRGHGHSGRAESYWFHDLLGDLSALMEDLFGQAAVPVVGHSLGGNVAGIYAGLRPDRVSHLISLDGFGPLVDHVPVDPLTLLRAFLDSGQPVRLGRTYPDDAAMAERLQAANPRLSGPQARWLAEHSSAAEPDGQRRWLFAEGFRRSAPSLRNVAEWGRIWGAITAPVLWLQSEDTRPNSPVRFPDEMDRRAALVPNLKRILLNGTGHNLHHDEPARTATLIEDFLTATGKFA